MTLTEGEALAAIEAAWAAHQRAEDDPDAMTRAELEGLTGWPRMKVHLAIAHLVKSGAWEHCKVPRPMVTGVTRPTDAYRPVR